MELGFILGSMEEPMKVLGKIIICMAKEFTLGVMEENMMESITWIRNTDMESTIGLMGDDMKDIGEMESNMVKENIFCLMELLR